MTAPTIVSLPGCGLLDVPDRWNDNRRRQVFGVGQRLQQGLLDLAELALVLDLQPEYVLDVEDIHSPHTVGGHMRRRDLEALFANRGRHIMQQSRAVAA